MSSKIMISLPRDFLKEIDRFATEQHRTRSELFREAIRHYMEDVSSSKPRPVDNPKVRAAVEHMRSIKWKGKWDSTEEIRKMRDSRYSG